MKKFFVALCVVFMSQTPAFSQTLDMSQMAYVDTVMSDSVSNKPTKEKHLNVVKEKTEEVKKVDKPLSVGDMFGMALSGVMMLVIGLFLLLSLFAPVRHS